MPRTFVSRSHPDHGQSRRRDIAAVLSAVAVLVVVAVVALVACNVREPSADADLGQAGFGELDQTLDPSAGAAASASPSASADPSATPTTRSLPAPRSRLANRSSYVYTPGWLDPGTLPYMFNSTDLDPNAVSLENTGSGSSTVTFAGLGTSGGVAHVQAFGFTPNYCTVASWAQSGSDEKVYVRCFNPGGGGEDTPFVASFTVGSQGSARFSYLWADQQSAGGKYHPDADYVYDSVDASLVTVQRTATGRYQVYLPAAGSLTRAWTFQITAYGGNKHCKLDSYNSSSRIATVACRTSGGGMSDSRFALTFASGASVIGRTDRTYGSYTGSHAGTERPSTGEYVVHASGFEENGGHVTALARGSSSAYCHVGRWDATSGEMQAEVACFKPGGAPVDATFLTAITL